jgi:hypothetical protein
MQILALRAANKKCEITYGWIPRLRRLHRIGGHQ